MRLPIMVSIFLLYLVGCSSGVSTNELSFKIENEVTQQKLFKELAKSGIPARFEVDGAIWFPAEYENQVHKIAFDVMESNKPSGTSIAYEDKKYTQLLVSKLRKKRVPHSTEEKDGKLYVVLSTKYEKQWIVLKSEVDQIIIDEARKSAF